MRFQIDIVKEPNFGNFGVLFAAKREGFYAAAMKTIVDDILKGIRMGVAITGGDLPKLEMETIELKGHDRPLIDKGLLSDEFTYQKVNNWRVDSAEISIKPLSKSLVRANKKKGIAGKKDMPRDQVAVHLQIDGVDSKHGKKFFRFFGISEDASKEVMESIGGVIQSCMEAM